MAKTPPRISLPLLLLIFCAGIMVLASCDHNITSSGFVDFDVNRQLPNGLYTGTLNTGGKKQEDKQEPFDPLPGVMLEKHSQRLALNIAPGKNGLKRVEFAMTARLTGFSDPAVENIKICKFMKISEQVSISHIMNWQGLEYYHFSAALLDPLLTEKADWLVDEFRINADEWKRLETKAKLKLGMRMARRYRERLQKEGWPIRPKSDPDLEGEVKRYRGRIANYVFAYDPQKNTLCYLDSVFDWKKPFQVSRKKSGDIDKDSIEYRFGSVIKYKAWLAQRIKEMESPLEGASPLTWCEKRDSPLLDDLEALSLNFLMELCDEITD